MRKAGEIKKYWVWIIVAALPMLTGGAIGGAAGGLMGYVAQKLIDRKPSMSPWLKGLIIMVAILMSFVLYTIGLLIVARLFPNLFNRPQSPA